MLQLLKDIILNQHAYAHVMRDCFPLSDKTEWEKEQEQRTTKKTCSSFITLVSVIKRPRMDVTMMIPTRMKEMCWDQNLTCGKTEV